MKPIDLYNIPIWGPFDEPSFIFSQTIGLNQRHSLSQELVGAWVLNEGVGDMLNDASGANNHLTAYNMDPSTDWIGSPTGHILDFDGSNDYAERVATSLSSRFPGSGHNGAMTIVGRFKTNRTSGTDQDVLGKYGNSGGQRSFRLMVSGTLLYFGFSSNGSTMSYETSTIAANNWYDFACVYDGANQTIYLNGVLANSMAYSGGVNNGTDPFRLGDRKEGDRPFDGQLEFVYIYIRALNGSEVTEIYNNPYAMFTPAFTSSIFAVPVAGGATGKANPLYGPLGGPLYGSLC